MAGLFAVETVPYFCTSSFHPVVSPHFLSGIYPDVKIKSHALGLHPAAHRG